MGTTSGASRLVVAHPNLRGYRGLTLDAYGALLQGGPSQPPRTLARLLSTSGRTADRSVGDAWRKALRTHFAADPFIAFREVHRLALQELFREFGIRGDIDSCIDDAFDEYRRESAYPEVSSVLRELEHEVPMAVVSNMDTAVLLEALHRNGLSFTFVVASDEEQRYKPHTSIFQRAVRYLGLPAANVFHVGDSYLEDIVGARSVGMGAALIDRHATSVPKSSESVRVIRGLRELPELLHQSWR